MHSTSGTLIELTGANQHVAKGPEVLAAVDAAVLTLQLFKLYFQLYFKMYSTTCMFLCLLCS